MTLDRAQLPLAAALLLAAPLGASPGPLPQDDGPTVAWYDLRVLAAGEVPAAGGVHMDLPIRASRIDLLVPEEHDVPLPADVNVSVDACVDALERAIAADPAAEVELLDVFAGRVRLTGNGEAHRVAARTLASLAALAADAAEVEVARIPAGRLPAGLGTVLDPERTAQLMGTLADLPVLAESIPLGRRAGLGAPSSTAYLVDYDVEVASSVMAPDPVVSVVRHGFEVGLRVDRAADGRRFVVRAWGRDVELSPTMRSRPQPGFAGAAIELPAASVGLFAGSGIVPAGGSILLRHGEAAVLVRVSGRRDGAVFPSETVTLGEHLLGPMRVERLPITAPHPSGGWPREELDLAGATAPWADDGVALGDFVDEILGLRRPSRSLVAFGSRALFVGPDDERSELRTAFDEYAAAAPLHTFGIELAHAVVEPAVAARLRAGGDLGQVAAMEGAGHAAGAVLEGDTLLLVGGEEAAYVQDYDVQIASGSSIQDPIPRTLFDGLALWASPVGPAAGGGVRAWIDLQVQRAGDGLRELPIANYRPGSGDGAGDAPRASGTYALDLAVELPAAHRAGSRGLVTLAPDRWGLVTVQPLSGTGRVLVVVARGSARR